MTLARRLARLEAAIPAAPAPACDARQYRAWLATLPDADLDVMEDAAARLRAGTSIDGLGAATCEAMARIRASWDAWRDRATS